MAQVLRARLERDVPTLIDLLRVPRGLRDDGGNRPDVRCFALRTLRKVGDERAVEPILALLKDPEESVQLSATIALGRIGDPRAIPPLLEILGDSEDFLRRQPGFIGWQAFLRRPSATIQEHEITLRGRALDSLASLGARAVLPTLLALLEHRDRFVREWAARLLARLGDPTALPHLRAAEHRAPFGRRRKLRNARRQLERAAV